MAEIGKSLKGIWLKSMEAISNTASNIASNTKYKVDEMNIVNRRREILSDFGAQAYELWEKGETFPAPLDALLKELSELDEALNAIRTEKLAGIKTGEEAQPEDEEVKDEEDVLAATEEMVEDVADAIEDTAEAAAEIAKNSMAEKFDNAVDAVGATFKKLGNKIEGGLEALTKAMKPKTEEDAAQPEEEQPEETVPVIEVEEPAEEAAEVEVSFDEDMPAEPVAPVISVEPEQAEEEPQA